MDKRTPGRMQNRRPRGPLVGLLLVVVLLLAAFFRLYRLRTLPWGLSQDEVVNANISLGVLAGEGAPFLAGGFGHEPLFHYLQAVTLTLFGDNVIGIRMPAVMLGMLLVAVSYTMMRTLTRGRRSLRSSEHPRQLALEGVGSTAARAGGPFAVQVAALTTAFGLAISWWPVIFSRIGIRAISFPLLLSLGVLLLWRGLTPRTQPTSTPIADGRGRKRRQILVLLSGVFFGLTVYTYTAARILPALVLAWLVYAAVFHRASLKRHWRALVGAGLIALVVAAPLVLYLRAHPELQERVQQLEGPMMSLRQGDPGPLVRSILVTLAMFSRSGEARWTYAIPGRPALGLLSGLLFYLGVIRCVVQVRRPACGLLGPWLIVALVPSMVTPDAPSSIRAIGALPAAYGMVGLGAAWLWEWGARQRRARREQVRVRLLILIGVVLSLVGVTHLVWTYRDGFVRWPAHYEVYWRYKAHFADIAAFLDGQLDPRAADDADADADCRKSGSDTDVYPMVVFEEWVDPVDVDGLRRDLVHDERQPRWAQAGRSFIWPADVDCFTLAMPIFSAADADIWRLFAGDPPVIAASSYRMADGRPGVTFYAVQAEPALSDFLVSASAAPVTLPDHISSNVALPMTRDARSMSLPLKFGDQFAFLGYQVLDAVTNADVASGAEFRLITMWRVLRDSPEPVNVFVHLLNGEGDLVGQHDGFDVWAPSLHQGDLVAQLHPVPLEADVDVGSDAGAQPSPIQIGVYRRVDMQRLPVIVDGAEITDRLWLASWR